MRSIIFICSKTASETENLIKYYQENPADHAEYTKEWKKFYYGRKAEADKGKLRIRIGSNNRN